MKVLVTGATGFVGGAVVARVALDERIDVCATSRRNGVDFPPGVDTAIVGDLTSTTDWHDVLEHVDVVIHSAARVHVMNDSSLDPVAEFRRVNVDGTLNLARQTVEAGVRRFIFISSIKVNGESTTLNHPYSANDKPNPTDPYGISKYEAELGLQSFAEQTGLEVVIIRPVLVYGPGVRANFLSMMRWLNKGIPLPLGAINNKRSLVSVDNLVDLIICCIDHPNAANQVFLVSDDEDLSTSELLQRMACALSKSAILLPMPSFLLRFGAALLGKPDIAQRLLGSLQVDITKTKEMLGWVPPVNVGEALKKTAEDFLARDNH